LDGPERAPLPLVATAEADPLAQGAIVLGGVPVEEHPGPSLSSLPLSKRVRRSKVGILDAPEDDETPIKPYWRVRQPERAQLKQAVEVQQLALF
jgi:hypothetical protein